MTVYKGQSDVVYEFDHHHHARKERNTVLILNSHVSYLGEMAITNRQIDTSSYLAYVYHVFAHIHCQQSGCEPRVLWAVQ